MSHTNKTECNDDAEKDCAKAEQHTRYTEEQKIVAAVWFHERKYNLQSYETLQENFEIRFNTVPPSYASMSSWEKTLFCAGTLRTRLRFPKRLKYIPHIEASLKSEPNLSVRERARKLGLTHTTLGVILKFDLGKTIDDEEEICEIDVKKHKIKEELA